MNIKSINLCNFKSYKGLTCIENLDSGLSTTQNIILFGGLNGAGKTTFLEALFLCFYGSGAKSLYPSRGAKNENYGAYLSSCLNDEVKAAGVFHAEMYVEVHIEGMKIVGQFPKNIVLRRIWTFKLQDTNSILNSEEFSILENGMPIQELPSDEYQDKIYQILPYSVAQFFFFDGEKIQDFAADADTEFANSLKEVLGITMYTQLISDLKEVRRKILNEYNKNKEIGETLKQRESEKARLENMIYDSKIKISTLQDDIDALEVKKEQVEIETFRKTRIVADKREAYQAEKERKEVEKETLEKDYFDTAKDYLPFILANNLCLDLEQQLEQEASYLKFESAQKALEPEIEVLTKDILDGEPPCKQPLSEYQKKFYTLRIDEVLRQFLSRNSPEEVDNVNMIHYLSEPDQQKILQMLQNYNHNIVNILQDKAAKLKRVQIDLARISRTEIQAGDNDEAVKELFDQKDDIVKQIGAKQQEIKHAQHSIDEGKRKLIELEKQITNLSNKADLHNKQRRQMEYCEELQKTISDFQVQFQAKRSHELETAIFEMWNLLAQKEEFISRIQILPERNFEVKIYGYNGREKDKTKLSAGEKEIYAISLLWALVQVSGKRIPIVIDTPYGRLDSKHRANLAKHYFPKASHQVILLSQDEEIVNEYYELLKPSIANEFSITYNAQTRTSEVTKGYKFIK